MRCKRGRIDRKRLILVTKIEILLQRAGVDRCFGRAIAAIRLDLQIPPPFLD